VFLAYVPKPQLTVVSSARQSLSSVIIYRKIFPVVRLDAVQRNSASNIPQLDASVITATHYVIFIGWIPTNARHPPLREEKKIQSQSVSQSRFSPEFAAQSARRRTVKVSVKN
jgi:hypothetical protein